MAKKKLIRIATLERFPHIIKDAEKFKGNWKTYFQNNNPITAELGCGKGDYTIALAERYPQKNFIGIDIKGPRLWIGAHKAEFLCLSNVAFIRFRIEFIADYFQQGEIQEVWITFPDPYPKRRQENRRLTSPNFLNRYAAITTPQSKIHLKTDDDVLYRYTLEVLEKHNHSVELYSDDLYNSPLMNELTGIQTTYEKQHIKQGKTIKYIMFTLGNSRKASGRSII
ncbi:tRNA (guanosine(46)-N7)-methyltransferase TrmB [candidate division KSB1 bacterium]|nr:tRNA (guanosine(46)-N7)-methyltransferase TrmB [candidate division KSB1 bacterium]